MAKTLTFGMYKGEPLDTVPADYLEWLVFSSKQTIAIAEEELTRRQAEEEASMSVAERIINSGWRALCKLHHPDVGGDNAEMQELNVTRDALAAIVKKMNGKRRKRD